MLEEDIIKDKLKEFFKSYKKYISKIVLKLPHPYKERITLDLYFTEMFFYILGNKRIPERVLRHYFESMDLHLEPPASRSWFPVQPLSSDKEIKFLSIINMEIHRLEAFVRARSSWFFALGGQVDVVIITPVTDNDISLTTH